MLSSQVSSFLELATQSAKDTERAAVLDEFSPKFAASSDPVEFDLTLWSLAARLRTDTEELLRKVGALWANETGLVGELVGRGSPLAALERCFSDLKNEGISNVPLPGFESFQLSLIEIAEGRVKIVCEGPRRCCSFLEGMARAICDRFNASLRYQRFPKGASLATIVFSVVGE